jgi:hypothetical protein
MKKILAREIDRTALENMLSYYEAKDEEAFWDGTFIGIFGAVLCTFGIFLSLVL